MKGTELLRVLQRFAETVFKSKLNAAEMRKVGMKVYELGYSICYGEMIYALQP